jgi:4-hydroxybutyrate CoA-transferase
MPADDPAPRAAAALLDSRKRATMVASLAPCQPDALLAACVGHARAHGIKLTVLFGDMTGRCAFVTEHDRDLLTSGQLRLVCLAGAVPRWLSPHVDFFPNGLYDVARWIADGTLAVDIAVALVTARPGGGFDLGDMIGYTPAALDRAGSIGLEVLPGGSDRVGDWGITAGRADALCAAATAVEPAAPATAPASPVRDRIGELVGGLIPDDATLELGIGAVPEAVVPYLGPKTALGLHSGILPASLRTLVAAGAFDGSAKSYARGRHVATGVVGGGGWGDRLRLEPLSVTHAPGVLARQHRFWAVNSAMEVDLLGQVNAEYAAGARVASGGGQADFFRAAHLSEGGAAVVAIPARTGSGRPRIVPRIRPPHGITTAAADVDIVVTEYGHAELRGATAAERARRMIAIAHPDDRKALQGAYDNGD